MLDLRLALLDQHVAEAIAAARIADRAIGTDIIPNLWPRFPPKDVRELLNQERLFEVSTLVAIEGFIETAEHAIDMARAAERDEASSDNASSEPWELTAEQKRRTRVYLALPVLHDLRDRLQAIRDLVATRGVLERLNAEH